MLGADTVPEEFYLALYPLPLHFLYDGQGASAGVFPQTSSLGQGLLVESF